MNNKLIISWDEYNKTVEELALKIHNSGFKVDLLIGIMRGVAPIIDTLSRILKLNVHIWQLNLTQEKKLKISKVILFFRES